MTKVRMNVVRLAGFLAWLSWDHKIGDVNACATIEPTTTTTSSTTTTPSSCTIQNDFDLSQLSRFSADCTLGQCTLQNGEMLGITSSACESGLSVTTPDGQNETLAINGDIMLMCDNGVLTTSGGGIDANSAAASNGVATVACQGSCTYNIGNSAANQPPSGFLGGGDGGCNGGTTCTLTSGQSTLINIFSFTGLEQTGTGLTDPLVYNPPNTQVLCGPEESVVLTLQNSDGTTSTVVKPPLGSIVSFVGFNFYTGPTFNALYLFCFDGQLTGHFIHPTLATNVGFFLGSEAAFNTGDDAPDIVGANIVEIGCA